ncbi:transmembrane protein 115 [Hydra vulgaris]|uniref:transmembrane protein 115 n=1 Tax=Hydra vulgaris TaxID=6087 RepID=UPI0006417BC4|nr:transmembrane protein 115-like [Hydra vulgaris]
MQQFISSFLKTTGDASIVIKSSIAAIFFSYILALIPGVYGALSITPSLLLPPNFQLWTLITGILVEASLFNVVFDIPILFYCGKFIEPLWGALELLKYIAITGIGTALLTSLVSLAAYASTQNYDLWSVQFSGGAGVIGGLMVAFKQIIPDQKVNLKFKEFYVHECPLICVLIYVFLSVVKVFSYTQPIMMSCGIIVGWSYLRFYQPRGRGMRGDMSESFEFASLLPPFLRFPVRFLSNNLFRLMVKIGVCTNPVKTYDVGAPSSITISLPGSDPVDAERRRKKALRALNERLVKMKKTSPDNEDSWPTIEDEIKKTEFLNETSPSKIDITVVDNRGKLEEGVEYTQ